MVQMFWFGSKYCTCGLAASHFDMESASPSVRMSNLPHAPQTLHEFETWTAFEQGAAIVDRGKPRKGRGSQLNDPLAAVIGITQSPFTAVTSAGTEAGWSDLLKPGGADGVRGVLRLNSCRCSSVSKRNRRIRRSSLPDRDRDTPQTVRR